MSKIIELNKLGHTNRNIAKIINTKHHNIGYYLRKMGLRSTWARQPINKISDTEAKCSKCNEIKSLAQFQHGRRGQPYEYTFSYCNECRKKQGYLNANKNIKSFLNDKYARLKRRAKAKNIEFNISLTEFTKLFEIQKGKCYYTNTVLECSVGTGYKRNAFSIDRVDSSKGYVKGNVVFCTSKVNTVKSDLTMQELKSWIPKWYKKTLKVVSMWRAIGLKCLQVAEGNF